MGLLNLSLGGIGQGGTSFVKSARIEEVTVEWPESGGRILLKQGSPVEVPPGLWFKITALGDVWVYAGSWTDHWSVGCTCYGDGPMAVDRLNRAVDIKGVRTSNHSYVRWGFPQSGEWVMPDNQDLTIVAIKLWASPSALGDPPPVSEWD